MKVRSATITAGGSVTLGAGTFFMLVETVDPVDVTFLGPDGDDLDDSGEQVEAGYKTVVIDGFSTVKIESATTQTIKYGIKRKGFGAYDRAAGLVDINSLPTAAMARLLWSELARLDAGTEFWGHATRTAVASQYSAVQLWNPVGSGITLEVQEFVARWVAGSGRSVWAGYYNTSFASASGTLDNKDSDGAAPGGELHIKTDATFGNVITDVYTVIENSTGDSVLKSYKVPPRVNPGEGFVVVAGNPGVYMDVSLEWSEH